MQAAKLGLRACVRVLLQRGACVNTASDGDAHTPLHYAAYYNREHVAEVLLRAGADTAALNKYVLARVGRRRERYGLLLCAVSCRWLIRHACGTASQVRRNTKGRSWLTWPPPRCRRH